MNRIPLSVPFLGGSEREYLADCVDTNFVSSVGPYVERFEHEFAAFVGARHAVACASGTAALHVALHLAGAAPGRQVAVSTFTFIASVNAVTYTGAAPLLVDSERETWNLDSERLYDYVSEQAKAGRPLPAAIEVVHLLGQPARMEPVVALREEFGIPIVEDAAEALGAMYTEGELAGRQVGTIGDFGCYSFNGNKTMTTGGGGMIVTDDDDLAGRARHLTTQARLPGREYAHDAVGFNYRLTNVAAALGVAQLEQLPRFLDVKRGHAQRYRELLRDAPVELPPDVGWSSPSAWLFSVLLHPGVDRDLVLDLLDSGGVDARPLWVPAHLQTPYRAAERIGGTVSEDLVRRGLSLPSSVGLERRDQDRVVELLQSALSTSAPSASRTS